MNDHLTKPVDPKNLTRSLGRWITGPAKGPSLTRPVRRFLGDGADAFRELTEVRNRDHFITFARRASGPALGGAAGAAGSG